MKVQFYLLAPTVAEGKSLLKCNMDAIPQVDHLVHIAESVYKVKLVEWYRDGKGWEVVVNVVKWP